MRRYCFKLNLIDMHHEASLELLLCTGPLESSYEARPLE